MAVGEAPIPNIPLSLMAEVEKVARAQDRTVSQVVTDAVDRYVKDAQWQRLKTYGHAQTRAHGLTKDDVPRLIEESRYAY